MNEHKINAMASVLVTGGTGMIGKHLCRKLTDKGYKVKVLSHRKNVHTEYDVYYWDPDNREIDKNALQNTDHLVHLAGTNISSKRWSKKRKQEIVESRAGTSRFLYETISKLKKKPTAFISSSAVGFYGSATSEKIFNETDQAASDFLGETCREWEEAADLFDSLKIRTVKIRTSLVLAKEGPLSKIMLPIRMGIGSPFGTGLQYMPWVHIDDLCSIFILAIEDSKVVGALNAVAPDHKTNQEFTKIVAEVLNKTLLLPNVPTLVLKTLLGEMAVIALNGSRVSSEKIINAGYAFKFPSLEKALEDICKI